MEGFVRVSEFINELEKQGLVIIKEDLLHSASAEAKRKDFSEALKSSHWLTCAEISKAGIWGRVGPKAIYTYAKKYCKEGEILVNEDTRVPMRIINIAVKRIALKKGIAW